MKFDPITKWHKPESVLKKNFQTIRDTNRSPNSGQKTRPRAN